MNNFLKLYIFLALLEEKHGIIIFKCTRFLGMDETAKVHDFRNTDEDLRICKIAASDQYGSPRYSHRADSDADDDALSGRSSLARSLVPRRSPALLSPR